jgi:hypothetical protein
MQQQCAKHVFEAAENVCRTCGDGFCDECLVYAFGPRKPPLCIPCAVAAAGIRASAVGNERISVFRRFRARAEKAGPETLSPNAWPSPRPRTLPAPGA